MQYQMILHQTLVGDLTIVSDEYYIRKIFFGKCATGAEEKMVPVLTQAAKELDDYFSGRSRWFQVPVLLEGTPFCRGVWDALQRIPYGAVRSYQQIAAETGNAKAARAVGHACHINPIPILVPCHRVIGKSGALTGFAPGLDVKTTLLQLEQRGLQG